ncbi:MAG: hypothetical protein ISS72_04455 [Candidatus Brocadiae bacterium]|nr:hypothetical protein [Candidatus Brocadiia bacterium]
MNLWEHNKLFVIFSGAVFVVYVYLWPSIGGRWLAPWDGPVIARPDRQAAAEAQRRIRQYEERFSTYYYPQDDAVPVGDAMADAIEGNKVLLDNFEVMHRWMSFVPRYPFRIPDGRTEKNKRQRYVSQAYTFARDGELICDEYGPVREPHSGIVFSTSTRNIKLGDPYFGMRDMELPDSIADPDLSILQIALIHEVGQLALRCGVDEITSIAPRDPYTWQVKGKDVAKAFPLDATFRCDLPTLMKLLHSLDGSHGRVAEVHDAIEAPAAAAPKAPAPEAVPAAALPDDEPDDEPEDPAATAGGEARQGARKITARFFGTPTLFGPSEARAGLHERITLFRLADDESHQLVFVANAAVTRVVPPAAAPAGEKAKDGAAAAKGASVLVEAEIEPNSTLRFAADGSRTRVEVRRGDYAATRFLLVRSLKVKADEGEVKLDEDGFPKEVTPPHLVVDLSVAALQFLEIKMPKVAVTRRLVKRKRIHQGW